MLSTILLVLACLVGGAGVAGAGLVYWSAGEEVESPPTEVGVQSHLHLENFIVNLADADGRRFLRVGIDLGVEQVIEGETDPGTTALVRDTILAVLTTWESDPLITSEGKARLKIDLRDALQERIPELGVQEVYFYEFLVQR